MDAGLAWTSHDLEVFFFLLLLLLPVRHSILPPANVDPTLLGDGVTQYAPLLLLLPCLFLVLLILAVGCIAGEKHFPLRVNFPYGCTGIRESNGDRVVHVGRSWFG